MERVTEIGQSPIGLCGIAIEVGRSLHSEGLVRPLAVELVDEGVEAFLLLDGGAGGRTGGVLLQGEVHTLVASVLLGMSGFDALDGNAEAEPPDGELGEIEEAVELLRRTWRRYRPILYLAADSGMRPQEYLALSMAYSTPAFSHSSTGANMATHLCSQWIHSAHERKGFWSQDTR